MRTWMVVVVVVMMMKEVVVQDLTEPMKSVKKCRIWCIQIDV